MIAGGKNLLLSQGTLDLIPLYHLLLAQHYKCQLRRQIKLQGRIANLSWHITG